MSIEDNDVLTPFINHSLALLVPHTNLTLLLVTFLINLLLLGWLRSIEGCLKCIGMEDVKLFEHDHTRSCFLISIVGKATVFE